MQKKTVLSLPTLEIKFSKHKQGSIANNIQEVFVFTCPKGGVWVRGGWALGGIIVIWGWSFGTWFLFIIKDWAGLRLICNSKPKKNYFKYSDQQYTATDSLQLISLKYDSISTILILKYRLSHMCSETPPKASFWHLVQLVWKPRNAPFRCSMLETQEDNQHVFADVFYSQDRTLPNCSEIGIQVWLTLKITRQFTLHLKFCLLASSKQKKTTKKINLVQHFRVSKVQDFLKF